MGCPAFGNVLETSRVRKKYRKFDISLILSESFFGRFKPHANVSYDADSGHPQRGHNTSLEIGPLVQNWLLGANPDEPG